MQPKLDDMVIYPLKSAKGIHKSSHLATQHGLEHDRRYMLVNDNGEFITAREHPNLSLTHVILNTDGTLLVSHPQARNPLSLNPSHFSNHHIDILIWETPVLAQHCGAEYDFWFSEWLQQPVKLVYFGSKSQRMTSRRPEQPVAFADGYPYLIVSRASLLDVQSRCKTPLEMSRFRANLIMDDCTAFAEDSWQRIKIGTVIFEAVKPCIRCIFTTLDPHTARRHPRGEPLRALSQYRLMEKLGPTFGMNFVAINSGQIDVGSKVEVLEYREVEHYSLREKAKTKL